MTATFTQANESILGLFHAVWDDWVEYENVAGVTRKRDGIQQLGKPPSNDPWARVILRHFAGGQASLGGARSRYERIGLLTIQIFVPIGKGLSEGYELARIVAGAYEGKTGEDVQAYERDEITEEFKLDSMGNLILAYKKDSMDNPILDSMGNRIPIMQTTGVWFRNVRITEIGPSETVENEAGGDWFQINVWVNFEYDEVK